MDDQKNKWTDGWRYNSSPSLLWHANRDAILSQLWSLIESLHRNRPFCNSLHNCPRRQCPFNHPYRVFIPFSTVYMNDSKATLDFKFCSSGKPLQSRDRKINVFSYVRQWEGHMYDFLSSVQHKSRHFEKRKGGPMWFGTLMTFIIWIKTI